MEAFHLSFQRIVNAGMFKGIVLDQSLCLSHMFYADDAIFLGEWSDDKGINVERAHHPALQSLDVSYCKCHSTIWTIVWSFYERVQAWQEIVWKKIYISVFHEAFSKFPSKRLDDKVGWKCLSQKDTLWTKVIVAIHGVGGKIHSEWTSTGKSCWLSILSEVRSLQRKATRVWSPAPPSNAVRGYRAKSFRQLGRIGSFCTNRAFGCRWNWNLESTGIFSVASARRRIDEICLPNIGEETRWVKCVPIKINVLAWKIKTDALPTRSTFS
ncbi:hypothetical protein Tco_0804889 [Tanacetum coccineum]